MLFIPELEKNQQILNKICFVLCLFGDAFSHLTPTSFLCAFQLITAQN